MTDGTTPTGATQRVLRQLNSGLILETVKAAGPISRANLSRLTKLAKPTVSVIVDELIAAGSLVDVGEGEASKGGGRRPTLVAYVARTQAVIGVQVGVALTVVALADGLGVELARDAFATPGDHVEAQKAIAKSVRLLSRRVRLPRANILALGVCLPGLTDPSTGTCFVAPHLGWRDVDFGAPLAKALRMPVFVHNVAQAAAVAEQREGAGAGAAVMTFMYEDVGIGAALVVDGRVFHGAGGVSGELGHVRIPGQSQRCACGGTGCLETVASSEALLDRARRIVGDISVDEVFGALGSSRDRRAAKLLAETAGWLGSAAAWLVTLTNPTRMVLGGAFLDAGSRFVEAIGDRCRASLLPESSRGLAIEASALGKDAPVRGAILLALQASDSSVRLAFGDGREPESGVRRGDDRLKESVS